MRQNTKWLLQLIIMGAGKVQMALWSQGHWGGPLADIGFTGHPFQSRGSQCKAMLLGQHGAVTTTGKPAESLYGQGCGQQPCLSEGGEAPPFVALTSQATSWNPAPSGSIRHACIVHLPGLCSCRAFSRGQYQCFVLLLYQCYDMLCYAAP